MGYYWRLWRDNFLNCTLMAWMLAYRSEISSLKSRRTFNTIKSGSRKLPSFKSQIKKSQLSKWNWELIEEKSYIKWLNFIEFHTCEVSSFQMLRIIFDSVSRRLEKGSALIIILEYSCIDFLKTLLQFISLCNFSALFYDVYSFFFLRHTD